MFKFNSPSNLPFGAPSLSWRGEKTVMLGQLQQQRVVYIRTKEKARKEKHDVVNAMHAGEILATEEQREEDGTPTEVQWETQQI